MSRSEDEVGTPVTTTIDHGVAIIGCGALGTSLCRQILVNPQYLGQNIVGITKTKNNHSSILTSVQSVPTSRFKIITYSELISTNTRFKNVVFCAPPSGFEDYPAALRDAMNNIWAGKSTGGVFVFTSSGGVYGEGNDGEIVNEQTPICDPEKNPRAGRLIKAENVCRNHGGCILRLAGLYTLDRGAHRYWLDSGLKAISGREDGIVNLLHYDDAAGACIAAITAGHDKVSGKTFLISDGHPLTRKGICEAALTSPMYKGKSIPPFQQGPTDTKGKVYDGTWSNNLLQWSPTHLSFQKFMQESN